MANKIKSLVDINNTYIPVFNFSNIFYFMRYDLFNIF